MTRRMAMTLNFVFIAGFVMVVLGLYVADRAFHHQKPSATKTYELTTEEEGRPYHKIPIAEMVEEDPSHWIKMHSHIQVSGCVTYLKTEADRDQHIRMCTSCDIRTMDRKQCIVAEIPPWSTLPRVSKKAEIIVRGISRYDAERGHHWWEIHPVEAWEFR